MLSILLTHAKIFFITCLLACTLSCKKTESSACTANCQTYTFQGRIYNGVSNKGLDNQPFQLRWETFRGGNCFVCPPTIQDIYVGRTDAQGNFSFSAAIDTFLFNDYALELQSPDIDNFFKPYDASISLFGIAPVTNLQIAFYPTTTLQLRLLRTQNNNYTTLEVSHYWRKINFDDRLEYRDKYFGPTPPGNGDTTLNLTTVAGIKTVVVVNKRFSNFVNVGVVDSIVCMPNVDNSITIAY